MVLFSAMAFCVGYLIWQINTGAVNYSKTAVILIAAFFGVQDSLMVLSYVMLLRVMHKYFNDYLARQKRQLLVIFGVMTLSVLIQTLYFLAVINQHFCPTYRE